jgi:Ca-activated chloride channel homolog
MKRLLILAAPLILIMLAFRPIRSHTISGTITDEKGSPIPSASISVKGNTQATISDNKGVYHLVVAQSSGTIVFSAPGYLSVQESINGRSVINVTLKASALKDISKIPDGRKIKTAEYYNRNVGAGTINAPVSTGHYRPDYDEEEVSREGYDNITENIFHKVKDNPLSTFSIDVDAASYSNVRRFINQGQLPPAGAVVLCASKKW